MSPRGMAALVIAGVAPKAGLFSAAVTDAPVVHNLFSAVVIMAVVTTVVSPIILKRAFSRRER
jgi:Kef-type K+ transport system membrane component KefB